MSLKDSVLGFLKIDELKENFLKLIEAKFELKKLEIKEQIKDPVADLVFSFLILILGLGTYLLFIAALGLYLGNALWQKPWLGLIIMGLIHLLILIFAYIGRALIKNSIKAEISKKIETL
jgi:sterol desaturase/sphingolipid hydroxylase (fatty acid hydroxylase superfamily)